MVENFVHFRLLIKLLTIVKYNNIDRPGISVSIATGYGLESTGTESQCWRDISELSRPALSLTQPSVQWVPGLTQG
jgi:hypothetical protein